MYRTTLALLAEERRWQERVLLLLAGLFVLIGALSLSLAVEGRVTPAHLAPPLVWGALVVGVLWVLFRAIRGE